MKRIAVSFFLILGGLVAVDALYQQVEKRAARIAAKQNVRTTDTVPARGHIDVFSPDKDGLTSVSGWAVHQAGIKRATLLVDEERRLPLDFGQHREDVRALFPSIPSAKSAGFSGQYAFGLAAFGTHDVEVELELENGKVSRLPMQVFHSPPRAIAQSAAGTAEARPFHLILATSNLPKGGGAGVRERFKGLESSGAKLGLMVPVLYLRTTTGQGDDWRFDANFDVQRKCGDRQIAEDNLSEIIAFSIREQMPILFTLNGGVWADAGCDVPAWDVNDALEADTLHCQWNNKNEVMPDNYFGSIPGTHGAPQIARVVSYNIFNEKPRNYKKRNLQSAARIIAQFAQQHPTLFIGVNLDADTYMNPFFEGKQWYDYNPNTLRQFRHWLKSDGPYAGALPEARSLAAYRRPQKFTLEGVNALSGQKFAQWDAVEPPRTFSDKSNPYWENKWHEIWEQFRRHVVDVHYDELSEWANEAGLGVDKIFSSQGFFPPRPPIQPFPLTINSPIKNYDTGGMSVEGASPSRGRLGAVIYGESSRNTVKTEDSKSLFSTFNALSPGWGVVEFHPGDQRESQRVPTSAESLQSLNAMMHSGAKFVSVMAWNGGSGRVRTDPAFVALTSIRDTPLEYMMKHVMATRFGAPTGSLVWTFGSLAHTDDEGWKIRSGTGNSTFGQYGLKLDPSGRGAIERVTDEAPAETVFTNLSIDISGAAGTQVSFEISLGSSRAAERASVNLTGQGIENFSFPLSRAKNVKTVRVDATGAPGVSVAIHRVGLLAER